MDKRIAASVPMFAAALVVSFVQPYLSLPILLPASYLYVSARRGRALASSRQERDSLEFLSRLSSSEVIPFSKRAMDAAKGLKFEQAVVDTVKRWALGDASDVPLPLADDPTCLLSTMHLARDAVLNGANIDAQLKSLLSRQRYASELKMRHIGGISNTLSLIQAGNCAFFPAFAGVCRNIMDIGLPTQATTAATLPFIVVVAAYIALVAVISAFFQKGDRVPGAIAMASSGMVMLNIVAAAGSLMM